MLIADFHVPGSAGPARVGIVGSCRIHDPLKEVVRSGRGHFLWSAHNAFTHSPPEAKQHIDFCRGMIEIPDPFAPYIMRQDKTPTLEPRFTKLVEECSIFVVEISAMSFLRCGPYYFQQDYFAQQFVRGAGLPVLNWFRNLSMSPPSADNVTAAIAHLKSLGKPVPASTEEIFRTSRQGILSEGEFFSSLREVAFDPTKRWIFIPHFNVSAKESERLHARTHLKDVLLSATRKDGFEFYDPTPLVEAKGKAAALEGGGADTFHYAPAFLPVVGEAIYNVICKPAV